MALCKATLVGEIISEEIETRHTNDNVPVSKFTVKTSNNAYVICNCWGKVSESTKALKKGITLLLNGNLITYSQKREGSEYSDKTFQLNVKDIQTLGGHPVSVASSNSPSFNNSSNQSSSSSALSSNKTQDISDVFEDDDVPF